MSILTEKDKKYILQIISDLELKNYYYSQIKEWQNQENFK